MSVDRPGPAAGEARMSATTPVLAAITGVAFAAFPLLRPWGDTLGTQEAMAHAFADPFWVVAHLSGMIGWVLLVAAVAAPRTMSARAVRLLAAGVAAVLPFYGAETFALHALGAAALEHGDVPLLAVESAIRMNPVAVTLFGLGLAAAAIGASLLAVDTWRRGGVRWAGIPLAVLIGLYLPQFFAPDAVRMVHGVLLGLACVLWGAVAVRR